MRDVTEPVKVNVQKWCVEQKCAWRLAVQNWKRKSARIEDISVPTHVVSKGLPGDC
jgi:hypothetical protein